MDERQFNEAAEYANKQLKKWEVEQALEAIEQHYGLPENVEWKLSQAMDEWCEDNDLQADEWREWGDEEDVFFAWDEEQPTMTDQQKASQLLSFMEEEWDGSAIINALNPYLRDNELASLYDKLVRDNVIR